MGNRQSPHGACPLPRPCDSWQIPLQEWGDEEEDGITYSILLERYRLKPKGSGCGGDEVISDAPHTPSFGYCDYKTRKLRKVKAASLEKLVTHMITLDWASDEDESYVPCFLATYRAFTSTEAVLQLLLNSSEYEETASCEKAERQRAVRRILNFWFDKYPEDFHQKPDYPCLKRIINYLKNGPLEAMEDRQRATQFLKRFKEEDIISQSEKPVSFTDLSSYTFEAIDLLSLSSKEIAEHLTLVVVGLFQKLIPSECLGAIWGKRGRNESMAPTVSAIIKNFTMVTRLVTTSIVSDTKIRPAGRAKIIEKWIKIAQKCLDLRNISSLKAIMTALRSYEIRRLEYTWAAVNRNSKKTLNKLSDLVKDGENYKNIRKILSERPDQGTVPFIGMYLTDLSMLDMAHKDTFANGNINFQKRREEYEVLTSIFNLQHSCKKYRLHRWHCVGYLFNHMKKFTENESFQMSLKIEMPPPSYNIARLA